MPLLLTLRQMLSTPPHIVARKAFRKLIRKIRFPLERRRAYRLRSFAPDSRIPSTALRSILTLPLREQLLPQKDVLNTLCALYQQHRFDVLGSGWVENKHAVSCKGFGGNVYPQEEYPYALDPQGEWIANLINASNAEESFAIWQNIQQPYSPIDWQRDIRSGYSWSEGTWYKEIAIKTGKGIDPKVPWELGRMHHLLHVALAHYLSNDIEQQRQYVREFQNQILDFIALNPPQFGIQWKTAMDVAIRISNMLVARDILKAQGVSFGDAFERIFARSVIEHAEHIRANLEWSEGMRGNHYLANICGLLIAACYLPESPKQREWLDFCVQELLNETQYQFLPDGGNFEASLPYHRLSAEMLVWATAYALNNPHTSAQLHKNTAFLQRLHAIRSFTASYLFSSGGAPQIGDNDSGRFLPLVPSLLIPDNDDKETPVTDCQHHGHLLSSLDALFGMENPFQHSAAEYSFIKQLVDKQHLPPAQNNNRICRPAPDFGIYAYHLPTYQCVIRAGSIGQYGKGGHAHNDQLSFTLAVNGTELFVDCGTYCYTPLPEERNRFRATASHNTLILQGLEQNDWSSGTTDSLFWLNADRSAAKAELCTDSEWRGIHYGYPSPHRRSFSFRNNEIALHDECSAAGVKQLYFHCAPGSICTMLDGKSVRIELRGIVVELCTEPAGNETISIETTFYSRGYGIMEEIPRIVVGMQGDNSTTLLRIVNPA